MGLLGCLGLLGGGIEVGVEIDRGSKGGRRESKETQCDREKLTDTRRGVETDRTVERELQTEKETLGGRGRETQFPGR